MQSTEVGGSLDKLLIGSLSMGSQSAAFRQLKGAINKGKVLVHLMKSVFSLTWHLLLFVTY